jgi:predicted MFS family arabinose efflux permease
MLNGNYKTYVKNSIHDDRFLTIVGVVGAVGNGCSRFLWNLFFSKTGYKTVMISVYTLAILVFSTIKFSTVSNAIYLIEIFIINCCLGGFLVTTPTSLLSIYGSTTGSNIFGLYWENFGIANLIGYVFISQLAKVIGFDGVIYVCLGMTVVALILVTFTKFQGPWANDTKHLEFCADMESVKP